MALGDGIRRNIAQVDPAERALLRDAFLELNRKVFSGTRTDRPCGGVTWWFKQDEIHQSTHVHGGSEFVPWHREIVNRLEQMLRQINPQLSLHYWDWTQDPRSIPNANLGGGTTGTLTLFTPDFMGYGGSTSQVIGPPWQNAAAPWRSDGYYVPGASPDRDSSGNPADPPSAVNRSVSGTPISAAQDNAIVTAGDYAVMRGLLENAHNAMHGFVNMGGQHISFRDPFVFLLHSNVDRLFARWQTDPAHPERLVANTVYGSESDDEHLNSNIKPWSGVPPTTRPWAPPEDKQVAKTYKDPSVVAAPRYDTNVYDLVAIQSAQFPNVYLRMDGNGVTQWIPSGGGTVNCQFGVGSHEKFRLIPQSDGTVAVGSVRFPNAYLRMEGVTQWIPPGGGTVNCQFGVGPWFQFVAGSWEKFRLIPQGDGTVAVSSVQFPNSCLRMDGSVVTQPTETGSGMVNCQFGSGSWEKFRLVPTSL